MKKIILLFSIFILISCKNEKEKIIDESAKNLKIYLTSNIAKANPNFNKIDSLKIIEIDTISEKKEYEFCLSYLNNIYENVNDIVDANISLAKIKYQQANLGSQMYGGSYVNKLEYEDAKETSNKARIYIDSLHFYLNEIKKIEAKIPKSDSIKFKYFYTKSKVKTSFKDMTSVVDTFHIILSSDFKIIEEKEIIKNKLKFLFKN